MNELKFPVLLRSCWFGLNQQFSFEIRNIPVTTVQYTVLRTLYELKPKSVNQFELSRLISSNENNLSSIIKRLLHLGYVKQSSSPNDKREKIYLITPKGIRIFLEALKKATLLQKKILRRFSKKERKDLENYISKINKKMS